MSFPNTAKQVLDEAVIIANETIDASLVGIERPSRCSGIEDFVDLEQFVYEVAEHIETCNSIRPTELAAWMLEEFYHTEEA